MFTLKDLWNAVGGATDSDYIYIYTESGFWDWWQKSWRSWTGSFDEWMAKLLAAVGGGGSGPGSGEDPVLPDNPLVSSEPLEQDDYIGIVRLLRDIYGFFSGFFEDYTVVGVEDFLSYLTDNNSDMYGIFNGYYWGGSMMTTPQFWLDQFVTMFPDFFIPSDMLSVFAYIASIWDALPPLVRFAFTGCFMLACSFAILKMVF